MAKRATVVPPRIEVLRLPHAEGLELPAYKSTDAAGMDLVAAVPAETPMLIAPGAWAAVPTGLALALPHGTEGQVRPRSGLALRYGVTVLNSPGTIDADYRGEVQVLLINHGQQPFEIRRGDRIAQLVVAAVVQMPLSEVGRLDDTVRGAGGFGSTGVRSGSKPSTQEAPLKPSKRGRLPQPALSARSKKTPIAKSRVSAKRDAPKCR